MNFINQSLLSEKVYNQYRRELNNLFLSDRLVQLLIYRLKPQITLIASSLINQKNQAKEDIQQPQDILLGFFQACYVIQMNNESSEILQKATLLFNQILKNSEEFKDPTLHIQEELYKGLKMAHPSWESYDETEKFINEENASRFSADCYYASTQLQTHFPHISSVTIHDLAYYLALMNLSLAYVFTREEGIQNLLNFSSEGNFPEHQVIDHVIDQLRNNSNGEQLISIIVYGLKFLDNKLFKKMLQLDGGRLKRELLAVTLRHLFWNKIISKLSAAEERLQEIATAMQEEDFFVDSLDISVGVILSSHLWKECRPKKFSPHLFEQLRTVCPQITDEEIIEYLGELFFLNQEQLQDILSLKEDLRKNHPSEQIEQILSTFIFHQAGLNYIIKNISAILLAKTTYGDLKTFYSDELNWIPRDLFRDAHARFKACLNSQPSSSSSFQLSHFVNAYLELLKDQLRKFNGSQHEHQLILSPFEFYQLASERLNQILFSTNLIENPLEFLPVCPTTETQTSKILQHALEAQKLDALQNVIEQMQKADELFQLQSLFQDLLVKHHREEGWHPHEELKQVNNVRLADLFDGEGTAITSQLNETQVDISLRKELRDQIIELDLVGKRDKKGDGSDVKHPVQQVEQVIGVIKEEYNEAAFEKLLTMMIKDQEVKSVIIKIFEENWRSGDRNLFGKDIQEGSLLTEQKREQILKEARDLSSKAEITAELAGFKRRLNKDISQGKFVPYQQKMLQTRYADFFGFMQKKTKHLDPAERKQWQIGYRKIVSDAVLQLELKKIAMHIDQTPGSYIENTILNLRKLGDADDIQVRHERHEAELNVVKTLLEGQGLVGKEMQSIKRKLADAKLEGRLQASGVPREQIEVYKTIIQRLEFIYEQLLDDSKELKKDFYAVSDGFPQLRKQWLMDAKAVWLDGRIKRAISKCLEEIAIPKNWDSLIQLPTKNITEVLCSTIEPFYRTVKNGEIGRDVENSLMPWIEFHEKWKARLQGEMIQGLADEQETLIKGVCAGVAGRWAVNDQRFPQASVEELCHPERLKISKTDRFLQMAVSAAFKKALSRSSKASSDLLEKEFPPVLRNILGIDSMELIEHFHGDIDPTNNSYKILTPNQLADFKNFTVNNQKKLKDSHGVMVLRLDFESGAHRVYLRFDPKVSIFRLGEPNAGILELKNEEEFFECFTDLCQLFYKNSGVTQIRAMQLTLS